MCCSEQFYVRIEEKLPAYNTRIKLPELRMRDGESGRGACTDPCGHTSLDIHLRVSPDRYQEKEEGDVMTREELKHQSQLIVESKSKKKPWKNEKF